MYTINATITDVQSGQMQITFPYHQSLTEQHDFIRAGIVSTILDSACGYATFSLMPENAGILTIEFKINLLSPAKGEWFEAIGKVKKPGRSITISKAEMFAHDGENKKLIATMVGTLMAINDPKGRIKG